jgi:hypothetical protein
VGVRDPAEGVALVKVEFPKFAWVVHDDERDVATVVGFAETREQADEVYDYVDEIAPRGELFLWEVADIRFVDGNLDDAASDSIPAVSAGYHLTSYETQQLRESRIGNPDRKRPAGGSGQARAK